MLLSCTAVSVTPRSSPLAFVWAGTFGWLHDATLGSNGLLCRGFGLSPGISRAERRKVEEIVVAALNKMEGDLKGKYFSLGKMSEADRKQLVADHFLFKKGDRFLQSAGANRKTLLSVMQAYPC